MKLNVLSSIIDYLKKVFLKQSAIPISHNLNELQIQFVIWNAERLGITKEESESRFRRSLQVLAGGHGGGAFREFNVFSHEILQVFFSDNQNEIYDAYRYFAPLHFLRLLSVSSPRLDDDHPLVREICGREQCRILDYGCGLAQKSIALACRQRDTGNSAFLYLADIDTIRRGFLEWLCQNEKLSMKFLKCSKETPIPELPPIDVIIALEVFEHLHDPVDLFVALNKALTPGGMLLTNVKDHRDEFMHVSPNLGYLRSQIHSAGYVELLPFELYRKI